MNFLIDLDTELFLFLNSLHSVFFDHVMYWVSKKWTWVPFYLFLTYLVFRVHGAKGIYVLLAVALLVTLTDQISVKAFKNVFERLRPCHNESIQLMVHTVNDKCGGLYGFVSSHASNTFGMAIFIGTVLRRKYNRAIHWLVLWAAVVSYSRIYLGVHYPFDILGGALLGAGIGWLIAYILKRLNSNFDLKLKL